jgi:CRP-like cAMP-binding protein
MAPSDDLDRVSLLLGTYLFEDLSPAEVEPLARAGTIRHAARGEYLNHVGDPAEEVYLVATGQLKDSIVTEDGDEFVHSFFGKGMLFGEPGFFAIERNRVMAVIAVEPTTLLVIGREALEPFLQRHPQVVTRALEWLASVARNQTLLIATLSRRTLQERLLFRLVELADTNAPREKGPGITPKISQATLAAMVGVSRENVNRALGALAEQGIIRIEAGGYILPDLERIRAEISNGSPSLVRLNRRTELEV